jgi:CBS domain-containing protein
MTGRTVQDVMTQRVVSVAPHTSFKEIVRVLASNHVDFLPVVDSDFRVVGVVTSSDLLARFGARMASRTHHKHGTTAAELMSAPAVTTFPHADLEDAARLAVHERVTALPVVSHFGVLLGILTLTDIATVFLRSDADIARDVRDELRLRPNIADAVAVDIEQGVVTLVGTVPTAADGHRIVEAVRRVQAVVDVRAEFEYERGEVRHMARYLADLTTHQKGAMP